VPDAAARAGSQVEAIDRPDLEILVPAGARSVLDVGCGTGSLGAALKRRGVARVVGIETTPEAAEIARGRLDEVVVGDVEAVELPFGDGEFDTIVYGDVLEHLVDPWSLLRAHRRLLAADGRVVVSTPNVAHWRVVLALLRGRWRYTAGGVMDVTHLRWFTRETLEEMLAQAGLHVLEDHSYLPRGRAWLVDRLTRGRFRHLLVWRHVVVAGQLPAPAPAKPAPPLSGGCVEPTPR
jgi:2-polyprenyl-3-methyl-5-hydroxy-6-metoxy-1,4-benzoquinol methylase